jgi:hypothetical protein
MNTIQKVYVKKSFLKFFFDLDTLSFYMLCQTSFS